MARRAAQKQCVSIRRRLGHVIRAKSGSSAGAILDDDLLPEVPTIGETIPGYEVALWNGVFAPAGTPSPAVLRLSGEITAALRTDALRAKIAEQGSDPVGSNPEQFAAFVAAEIPKWAELVRISGARVE